eukprot:TRINITY_DN2285_c0_g1_i1.p1 TRINITY_DN2285_c0_g1~~TRINITY_DN2285_c0_g1_i1.p1  ORF type:complete len:649 (+),score=110.68 TRINITY_DN2285_c0_g1_i1:135-2081(+)
MTLPPELHQTLNAVQAQFESLHKRISELQTANQELIKAQIAKDEDQSFQENNINIPGTLAEVAVSAQATTNTAVSQNRHDVAGPIEEGELAWANKFNALRSSPLGSNDMEEAAHHEELRCNATCVGEVFYKFSHNGNCAQKFTEGLLFKTISISAIAANTAYLGLAGDYNLKNSFKRLAGLPQEPEWTHPDIVFTSWFTLEIIIRLCGDQLSFFTSEDQGWNIFDLLLVSESLVTLIISYASGGSSNSKLSFLRIFRVFRLVRVVRIVRSVKALAKLRTMIFAILNSFADLLWALAVVTLIVFVFAIVFMGGTAEYFDNIDLRDEVQMESARAVNALFGNIGTTSLSLWSAISGGNDWMAYGEQLQKFSNPLYFYIFQFYIAFCCVGLFNVVTGVFVDSAVCVRTEDEIVAGYFEELRTATSVIKNFFADADQNESGSLTFDEFSARLRDPAVRAYFAGLDIDPEEAGIIFTIFDADKSNTIQINELVNGTMKLKGSASKLDLMLLMHDLNVQSRKLDNLVKTIKDIPIFESTRPQEKAQHRRDLPRAQVVSPKSRAADGSVNAPQQHRSKDLPRGQVAVPVTKAVDGLVNGFEGISLQESQHAHQRRVSRELPRAQVVAPLPRTAVSPPRQRPAKLPSMPEDSEHLR